MSVGTCFSTHDELPCIGELRDSHQLHVEPGQRVSGGPRRKREFTPDDQKDSNYWLKRNRNNEAAKRSRLRKRMEEHLLETRAVELQRENDKLKAALSAVHHRSAAQNNSPNAFGYAIGLPNDRHVPTPVMQPRNLQHCPFFGCCGAGFVSYPVLKNAVSSSTKWPRVTLLDGGDAARRSIHGANTCTACAYTDNHFVNGNDSFEKTLKLPNYRSAMVNLSGVPRCYRSKTSPSETAQNYARQPGPAGATREGAAPSNPSERTCQQQATEHSVLLPHKLRYKAGKAKFASTYFSP